jgi:hypothetical protein
MTGMIALFFGCSGKNSDEACVHQVTMDLDQGNYDGVLASSCAGSIQRGAAYFGRAGIDITDVINRFGETSDGNGQTASDFNIYMTTLVGKVTEDSLADMDSSRAEYNSVSATSDSYKDAQFYVGLVDAVKGLSLLKIVLDADGDGSLETACDKNANNKPDEIDATGCALRTSAGSACTGNAGIVLDQPDITFNGRPGTYRGLIIQVDGAGANIAGCPGPNQYKELLYWQTDAATPFWAAVTTASGAASCPGSDGREWPCPLIKNGRPLDLVSTIDGSLNGAVSSMDNALSSEATTTNDVQQAIQDIKTQACPNTTCTSSDIANYLQTY